MVWRGLLGAFKLQKCEGLSLPYLQATPEEWRNFFYSLLNQRAAGTNGANGNNGGNNGRAA